MREAQIALDRRCARDGDTAPELVDETDDEKRESTPRRPTSNALGERHALKMTLR
jgi:hypothetical protein